MAFNVKIRFTGICAFVPNDTNPPTKYCVLLPHAFFEDPALVPDAPDATKLRRHRAMIQFPLRNVSGMDSDTTGATVVWYFENRRLTFDAPGAAPLTIGNLADVLDIGEVAPGFNKVDPSLLTPMTDKVAQVMFNVGHLEQELPPPLVWKLTPRVLTPRTVFTRLVNEVVLTISGINSFTIQSSPLTTGALAEQKLVAPAGGTIPITIAHLCQDNPLRWETKNFSAVDDIDMKWYFKLLSESDQADLNDALEENELPVPRPTPSGGQGIDCSPGQMAAASF